MTWGWNRRWPSDLPHGIDERKRHREPRFRRRQGRPDARRDREDQPPAEGDLIVAAATGELLAVEDHPVVVVVVAVRMAA
jgi:hypothetical protein